MKTRSMQLDKNMDAQQQAARIVAGLKRAGIDFVATLPDEKMVEVIRTRRRIAISNMSRSVARKRASASAPAPILRQENRARYAECRFSEQL